MVKIVEASFRQPATLDWISHYCSWLRFLEQELIGIEKLRSATAQKVRRVVLEQSASYFARKQAARPRGGQTAESRQTTIFK
ncbi:MAG: hypothetical protein DMG93_21325 [Acidobacteria bacterium]|nr:MAG: hypothetical protein DMG93_21325 [Acidobacteriota bacterium]